MLQPKYWSCNNCSLWACLNLYELVELFEGYSESGDSELEWEIFILCQNSMQTYWIILVFTHSPGITSTLHTFVSCGLSHCKTTKALKISVFIRSLVRSNPFTSKMYILHSKLCETWTVILDIIFIACSKINFDYWSIAIYQIIYYSNSEGRRNSIFILPKAGSVCCILQWENIPLWDLKLTDSIFTQRYLIYLTYYKL